MAVWARTAVASTVEERRAGLAGLSNLIFVDTRNEFGRPPAWVGMPAYLLPGARAYFVCLQEQDWTLRIERGGVPDEILESLRPHDISYAVTRNLPTEPVPWSCVKPRTHPRRPNGTNGKQPSNSLFMSAPA